MTSQWKSAPFRFEVDPPGCSEGRLVIRWRARNDSGREIHLFTRILAKGPDRKPFVDPNTVYTQVEGELLVVSKALQVVPPGCKAEWPDVPYVTRLGPNESFEEQLEIPLPVVESRPYMAGPPRKPRLVVTERVTFVAGWYVPEVPEGLREVTVAGAPFLAIDYGIAEKSAGFLLSGPFSLRCEALSQTAAAEEAEGRSRNRAPAAPRSGTWSNPKGLPKQGQ